MSEKDLGLDLDSTVLYRLHDVIGTHLFKDGRMTPRIKKKDGIGLFCHVLGKRRFDEMWLLKPDF